MTLIESLHEQALAAAQATGLGTNFGDAHYLLALQQLCADMQNRERVPPGVAAALEKMCVSSLLGRLYSEHFWVVHPEHKAVTIERPLFIIGLPRSGTTALQKLLAADPANQGLEYWLGQTPQPRPAKSEWQELAEFQQCQAALNFLGEVAPEMQRIHRMRADEADECRLLLMQDFANVTFQSNGSLPNYEAWVYSSNFEPVYQRYKKNLQLIGLNDAERRWVLKDPSHLWAPDTLLSTFPDACIVQLHRDPKELIPSVSSLVYQSRKLSDPMIDPKSVGRRELQQWSRVVKNFMQLRGQHKLDVFDLSMTQLQQDPLASTAAIYEHFDIDFSEQSRRALVARLGASEAQHSAGHHYTADQFGLSDIEVDKHFADYIDQYSDFF